MRTVRDDGATICSCCFHQISWSVSRCDHCHKGEWFNDYYDNLASLMSYDFMCDYISLNDFVNRANHIIASAKTEFNYHRATWFPQLTWENFLRDNPNIKILNLDLERILVKSNWQKEGF